jgi:hypothetical protein
MKNVIASRTYRLLGDSPGSVDVLIFQPVPDGSDFKCHYEVHWPDQKKNGHASGVDAIQSLILAIRKLGADLQFSEPYKSGTLVWLDAGDGLGLLLPKGLEEFYRGSDPP